MIVLDTSVVSELMSPAPDPAVMSWLRGRPPVELATTAVTLAEVHCGIARLLDGRRKSQLMHAAERVFGTFPDRVLPFDASAASAYADIAAHRERLGAPILAFDGQIAAICSARGAALATRNEKDFRQTGVTTTNPWEAAAASR